MARKARRKAKTKKAEKRTVKRAKARATAPKKTRKSKKARSKAGMPNPARAAVRSQRRQAEPIPADPAGRIGGGRPSNAPLPPGRAAPPRELAQSEPDARFDDPRRPASDAREHPGGSMPPIQRKTYTGPL